MTGPLIITGGTGLLGSAIRRIRPDAVCLSSADGDLRDASVARRLFAELRPSQVLHLAGREVLGVQHGALEDVCPHVTACDVAGKVLHVCLRFYPQHSTYRTAVNRFLDGFNPLNYKELALGKGLFHHEMPGFPHVPLHETAGHEQVR